MKALIVLENHFYIDVNKNVWCDRVVDYNYLNRYLSSFESIIVTGRSQIVNEEIKDKLLVSGKNVEFVPMPDFKGAKGLILNLFNIRKIIKIQVKRCDCAIYRAPTHLSLFTYKEVIKQKKPLAIEFMMAADKMFEGESIYKKVLNKIIDFKAKKLCMKANGVSYVTKYVLQKKYPCKAIKNGSSKFYFTESYSSIDLDKKMYFKQNWSINKKPKIIKIIHTGYMDSYRKGQDVLIKAAKIVLDKGYDIEVTFIGDGDKKKEFEILTQELGIQNKIFFLGLIKDKTTIIEHLRNSHMLVFPTQSEGLPRTIIEAMSQNLVCISSPVDGVPELLDSDVLLDYSKPELYADKIIEFIENWEKFIEYSNRNFEKSKEYSSDILKNKRTNFYNKIRKVAENNEDKNR